ncbi:hypothetical protein PG999_010470 [Apiospora kogelbergensis]|uniref:Uncharacterized protein n=1 Tax=Apiospora kogelbergensis TaxID=1337665 RepID=A0AAW0QCM0_9PEZI
MPMLSDLAIQLVGAIDDPEKSYLDIWEIVKRMAEDLHNSQDDTRLETMLAAVRSGVDGLVDDSMMGLLHSVHPFVLRSVCMGTIAYDFHDEDSSNWQNVYNEYGPGVYAVGIAIRGREGKFLTPAEIRTLLELLKGYAASCEAREAHGSEDVHEPMQLDDQQRDQLRVSMDIDKQYMPFIPETPPSERAVNLEDEDESAPGLESGSEEAVEDESQDLHRPRFSRGKDMTKNIHAVIRGFNSRLLMAGDSDLPQIQSPLVIGSSNDLQNRKQDYRPAVMCLRNADRVYWLIMSIIQYMGLTPLEVFVPFTKAWKVAHINQGEILGTLIGSSLVCAAGLNIHQPGAKKNNRPPDDVMFERTYLDAIRRDWYLDNMKHSVARSPHVQLQEVLDEIFAVSDQDIRDTMEAVEQKRNAESAAVLECEKAIVQGEQGLEEAGAGLEELYELLDDPLLALLDTSEDE